MFNFFKKKKPVEERRLGTFSAYDIEFVYDFLGEERINRKLDQLKNEPTMGRPFERFVKEECNYGNRGIINIFYDILIYFDNDLPLAIFLFNKSKNYNEINYHSSPNAKKAFETHLASMNRLIENKKVIPNYLKVNLLSRYWIDFHFFYMVVSDILKKAISRQKHKIQAIEGTYFKNGKKFEGNNLSFKINTKKDSQNSKYIVILNPGETFGNAFSICPESESTYKFTDEYFLYSLFVDSEFIKIEKIQPINLELDKTIKNSDLEKIVEELADFYLPNIDKISDRMILEYGTDKDKLISNDVLNNIADFYRFNLPMLKKIIDANNKYPMVWRKMDMDNFLDSGEE